MDPQRKNKKKRKGRQGSGGTSSPLANTSSSSLTSLDSHEGVSRENSSGSLTLDPPVPEKTERASTPSSVDRNLLNEILEEIRDIKQRLDDKRPMQSREAEPEPSNNQSNFLLHIETEKLKVRLEIEKKILEEENTKLKAKITELSDLNEHWKTKFYSLEAELDVRHTESDANMIEVYGRIGDLEGKVNKLEAERKTLLQDIKKKDEQIDTWKEKYIDLESRSDSERRIDITKINFNRPDVEGGASIHEHDRTKLVTEEEKKEQEEAQDATKEEVKEVVEEIKQEEKKETEESQEEKAEVKEEVKEEVKLDLAKEITEVKEDKEIEKTLEAMEGEVNEGTEKRGGENGGRDETADGSSGKDEGEKSQDKEGKNEDASDKDGKDDKDKEDKKDEKKDDEKKEDAKKVEKDEDEDEPKTYDDDVVKFVPRKSVSEGLVAEQFKTKDSTEEKPEATEAAKQVVEEVVKEATEAVAKGDEKENGKDHEVAEDAEEGHKEEIKPEEAKDDGVPAVREPAKRRHRSRLEKAIASGKLEYVSTTTLDTQLAKALQSAKSTTALTPVTPTSKSAELEAIADILKHDAEGDIPVSDEEPEADDLMDNLNKIVYREGSMARLPSTYSFGELDAVGGNLSDLTPSDDENDEGKKKEDENAEKVEKSASAEKVATLRTSAEKKQRDETDAQAHHRKVVLVQSVIRKHLARRKYKQIRKRAAIAKEIFVTERQYVKHLHIAIKVFLRPLRQRAMVSEDGFITIDKLQTIFSTFEIIMKANYALLKRLHEVIKKWTVDSCMGQVFIELLPLLEPHVDFVVNFEKAQKLLLEATKESPALNMFLRASLQNPDLERKDLADFLIMPVQRIPRYVMLLSDLERNTAKNHPDKCDLQLALTMMKDFADSINERKRSNYRVFQIKESITGIKDVDLLHTGRFLLCEGELKTKKSSSGERYFLFNDLLLCCKAKKGSSNPSSPAIGSGPSQEPDHNVQYKFVSRINIDSNSRVEDTREAKYPYNFKLVLGDHTSHVFTAVSAEDKQRWLTSFIKAILHSPSPFSGPHSGYDISTTDLRHM